MPVVLHVTSRLGTNALDVAARISKADTAAPAGRNLAHRARALPPRHSGQSVDGDDEQDGRGRLRRIDVWLMRKITRRDASRRAHAMAHGTMALWRCEKVKMAGQLGTYLRTYMLRT